MSKRRRTANPIFQRPLTVAEEEGTVYRVNKGTLITCDRCHTPGGTLVKIDDGVYTHQDRSKCNG